MRSRIFVYAVMMVILTAVSAFSALSRDLEDWGKGPAQHLMTRDELREWKAIRNDADAQAFIDLFWARRDPTPTTSRNEFKEQFEEVVKVADERFREGSIRGSMTERGKTMILLGPPSKISRRTETAGTPSGPDPTAGTSTAQQSSTVTEVWLYEGERIPPFVALPRFELLFRDDFGSGRFRSTRSQFDLGNALQRAVQQTIKSPNLTAVPQYAQPAPPPPRVTEVSVPAPDVTPATTFKTQSLQAAFTDFKSAKTSPYKDFYVTYSEEITPSGEYFVPVQVYLTKNPGAEVDQPVTFFGVVEDPQGEIVAVFEEPVKLQPNRAELFADKSLTLAPGNYVGTFGIAKEGKPLTMARSNMELKPIDRETTGISRLILSNNVYALSQAQEPTDPYAFGGIKVVPKGDRTFSRQDELWYFFVLRNPGVESTVLPATKTITESSGSTSTSVSEPAVVTGPPKPKIQVKVDVEAKSGQKLGAPLQEAPAEELKGVPGHFGVGSSIPLAGFAPGDYTIKIKVIDTVKKQNYTLQEQFKISG